MKQENNMKTSEEIENDFCKIITAPLGQDARVFEIDKLVAKNCAEYLQKTIIQCQQENTERKWTFDEILEACYPILGRGTDWANIAINLKKQKITTLNKP